tara:strand:+ start:24 stop:449 length:426 start_codon:yes stop_codon:yes gene_type:complete
MARTHGKNANFSFNAVAIEDELNEIVQTAEVPEADITSFNDAWQNFLAGKKGVVTEISGAYDPAASQGDKTIFDAIGGGPVSTVFDPTGSGPDSNDPEYQCTASGLTGVLVRRYSLNFPVGDKAGYRATLQHSGSTTRATA